MEMVNTRFRSTKSKERGLARQEIAAAAVSYSSADTEEVKRRGLQRKYPYKNVLD